MQLEESLRLSFSSIRANKMRSTLTMLGVVIGVAAVISMLSIGRGAKEAVESQITAMGTNLLFIRPGSIAEEGVSMGGGTAATLTYEDAVALADPANVPSAEAVAPESTTGGQVVYMGNNVQTRVTGVTPDYEPVRNVEVATGQFVSSNNLTGRARVAVLGAETAANLFGEEEPVGKVIRIMGQPFTVIGVLVEKGGTGFGSMDDMILIPLTTLQQRLTAGTRWRGARGVGTITVKVASKEVLDQATMEIQEVLRDRHNVLYDDDFIIQSQQAILDVASQMTDILTVFLGGVAAISLLVGGIGIMNIMLVSVTERTREIGIRKALGARKRDIQVQFLAEATVLSVLGGLLGVALGVGISRMMGLLFRGAGIEPVVHLDAILLATLFSAAVGIFFGIYPANRAAGLDPIDALRYE
ncbi:MAG TPA: ABC transporter permease [Anaerolineae bacterium]|nr:ABC transporter permease [Anaerolineae bacterium]